MPLLSSEDERESNKDTLAMGSSFSDLGSSRVLLPYYFAFMLDAIAIGIVMPVLPFTIMELKATALQLSLVVSANYCAQSIGVIVMGRISDLHGRRIVMMLCLIASALSYLSLSNSTSLVTIALSRIISGSFGGLLPVMQSAVADVVVTHDRPKYMGRIVATFGLGFVLGPTISAMLTSFAIRQKILFASTLPFLGWLIMLFLGQETKQSNFQPIGSNPNVPTQSTPNRMLKSPVAMRHARQYGPINFSPEMGLLVLNGFCVMYAFATETIYAMFMKDVFGYGEESLSLLFASNGIFIGIFQVFFIKPLISNLGKHATLGFGNMMLSIGMCGFALTRHKVMHFVLFTVHIVGYSIADTTLASLISTYSSPLNQGKNLSYNQAAQAVARVIGPLLAGFLYEYDKVTPRSSSTGSNISLPIIEVVLPLMPQGSLPFVTGSMLPACAVLIPLYLYMKEMPLRRKLMSENDLESKFAAVESLED